jgi:sigma-E factor negative regulatory protein RseA
MSIGSEADPSALEKLSALVDGELDSIEAARACTAWRDDADARASWHTYQLIGDVLRSEDLSSSPSRDIAFLAALRSRLAVEPVVLAPKPLLEVPVDPATQPHAAPLVANGTRSSRWSWIAPSTVAAGFVLVTGALLATRSPLPAGGGSAGSLFARIGFGGTSTAQVANVPTLTAADASLEPQTVVLTGKMIRDTRVDRYLTAHQQFAGTSALGVPSGFLRNAAAEAPNH